jgi:hypothetical protein
LSVWDSKILHIRSDFEFSFSENVNAENDFDNDSIILKLVPETPDVEIIKVSAPKRKLQMPITHFFKKPKDFNL